MVNLCRGRKEKETTSTLSRTMLRERIIALSRDVSSLSPVVSPPPPPRRSRKREKKRRRAAYEEVRETIAKYKWHVLPALSIFILGQGAVTGAAIKSSGHLSVGDTTRRAVVGAERRRRATRRRTTTTVGLTTTFAFQINAVDGR